MIEDAAQYGAQCRWICRMIEKPVHRWSSCTDFDGATKEEAEKNMHDFFAVLGWSESRYEMQLFERKPKEEKRQQGVICGHFGESELRPCFGGWDLH